MSSFTVPDVDEIEAMSPADLEACLRALEGQRRRFDAKIATFINHVDTTRAYLTDHHRCVRAWGQAACNWSGSEAFQFQRVGRMLARLPLAAAAAANGELGVAQMQVLAAVVANPRVR